MLGCVVAAIIDAILSGGLLAIYGRNFSRIRAPFTVGLLVFAAVFLIQNLLAVYAFFTMMELFPPAIAPYMLGVMTFEAVGLGAALYGALQ